MMNTKKVNHTDNRKKRKQDRRENDVRIYNSHEKAILQSVKARSINKAKNSRRNNIRRKIQKKIFQRDLSDINEYNREVSSVIMRTLKRTNSQKRKASRQISRLQLSINKALIRAGSI